MDVLLCGKTLSITDPSTCIMQVLSGGFNEKDVLEFLAKVPIKLGQGKANVSLDAVLPKMCVQDILRAVEDFERDN